MTKSLRIGGLFSGIGGLELGLEMAGVGKTVWQVEREPFCQAVLRKHWPEAELHDDVTTVDNLPYVDVICGGFPCQGLSVAGKKKGLADERSNLFYDLMRVVRSVGPRYIILENSPHLVNRALEPVLSEIRKAGYNAAWSIVSAADAGLPHLRKRWFLIAWRRDLADPNSVAVWDHKQRQEAGRLSLQDGGQAEPLDHGAAVADPHGRRCQGERVSDERRQQSARGHESHGCDSRGPRRGSLGACPGPDDLHAWRRVPPESQPGICRMADGLPPWMGDRRKTKRLRALGNAVCPPVAQLIGEKLLELIDTIVVDA